MAKGKTEAVPMPDQDWQCRDDADTLTRAAEIVADKERFARAKAHVEKKRKGLDKLFSGLRR